MLKRLSSPDKPRPAVVTLVPFSGIQFMDFGFNLDAVRIAPSFWEQETEGLEDGGEFVTADGLSRHGKAEQVWYRLHQLETDPETKEKRIPGTENYPPLAEIYTINAARALEIFAEAWVPIPMLRALEVGSAGQPRFDIGPTNWVRARVVTLSAPDEHGNTHRVVLAIDTALAARSAVQGYPSPTTEDSGREDEFVLAGEFGRLSWFISLTFTREWILRLSREHRQRRARGRAVPAASPNACDAFARYIAFIELLETAIDPPSFKLLDTLSESSTRSYIPVDLVLDIGNSRTCGVIIEDQPNTDEIDLTQSYPLELRDLGVPCNVYSDPFQSRVEFSRAEFGFSEYNRHAGRNAFKWGSLVRVGPEAVRLAGDSIGNEGSTGLSSPKRYLWDTDEAHTPWRFNGRSSETGAVEPVVSGPLLFHLTDDGSVRSALRRPDRRAMTPLFSRSSLFTLMLTEILQQALSQINAPAVRAERMRPNEPRRISKVIMSLPPATPLPELKIMRERAKAAVGLVWDVMQAEAQVGGVPPKPDIDPKWDEASATQLVYLFSEIKHNFRGDIQAFFRLMGREREPSGDSLRVASIDIGGGTSDLIITTYTHEGGRAITPKQEFRESFRLAGDDILQAVIEQQVMASIQAALDREGLQNRVPLVAGLFAGDRAGLSEQARHQRRQFVNKCLVPVALALMHRTEEAGPATDLPLGTMSWDEVFDADSQPSDAVLNYLDAPVSEALGRPWTIRNVHFALDTHALTNTVWGVIGDVLRLFAEAVHGSKCDVLLLSGRPSRLPAIQSLVLALAAVPADRVIPMHHYAAGRWYPFRDEADRIADPKTTAVVGAALCELASGQIQRFRVDASQFKIRSTARYIGEMEQSGYIKNQRLFFSEVDLDDPNAPVVAHRVQMFAPMEIGFRQFGIERWPATLLYRLAPADRSDFQRYPAPWTCTIERAYVDEDAEDSEEQREIFAITEVEDRDGNSVPTGRARLRLQTLRSDQGYWLDTGVLRLT